MYPTPYLCGTWVEHIKYNLYRYCVATMTLQWHCILSPHTSASSWQWSQLACDGAALAACSPDHILDCSLQVTPAQWGTWSQPEIFTRNNFIPLPQYRYRHFYRWQPSELPLFLLINTRGDVTRWTTAFTNPQGGCIIDIGELNNNIVCHCHSCILLLWSVLLNYF